MLEIILKNFLIQFQELEELNNIVGYCKWLPLIYLSLSECYRLKKVNELFNYYQQQADNLYILAKQKISLRPDLLSVEMFRRPPSNLNDYLNNFIFC